MPLSTIQTLKSILPESIMLSIVVDVAVGLKGNQHIGKTSLHVVKTIASVNGSQQSKGTCGLRTQPQLQCRQKRR